MQRSSLDCDARAGRLSVRVPTPGFLHHGLREGVGSVVKWKYGPPSARHLGARESALGACDDGACSGKSGTNYVVLYRPCVRWWTWARSPGTVLPLWSRLFTGECGGCPVAAGVNICGRVFTRHSCGGGRTHQRPCYQAWHSELASVLVLRTLAVGVRVQKNTILAGVSPFGGGRFVPWMAQGPWIVNHPASSPGMRRT
jgi:hypothetical protein